MAERIMTKSCNHVKSLPAWLIPPAPSHSHSDLKTIHLVLVAPEGRRIGRNQVWVVYTSTG